MSAYQGRHAAKPVVASTSQPRGGNALGLLVTAVALIVSVGAMVITVQSAPSGAETRVASTHQLTRPTPVVVQAAQAIGPDTVAVPDAHTVPAPVPVRATPSPSAVLVNAGAVTGQPGSADVSPLAADGIPVTALQAYQDAANALAVSDPQCGIPWPLLAGIGRVESDHGRFAGATLYTNGTASIKILGPVLDGNGTAVIADTDGGALDGNAQYDRAMGPLQFIPSTWARYASDGNGDGVQDPFNIFDESLAAAKYLCAAGGNLTTTAGQVRAVFSYNHLDSYVNTVIGLEHAYAAGAGVVVPDPPATSPGGSSVTLPVVSTPVVAKPVTKKPVTKPVTKKPVTTKPVTKPVTTKPVQTPPTTPAPPTTPTPPTTTPPTTTPPTTPAPPGTLTCPPGTQPIPVTTGSGSSPTPTPTTGPQSVTGAPSGTSTSTPAPGVELIPGTSTPVPTGCMLDPAPGPGSASTG